MASKSNQQSIPEAETNFSPHLRRAPNTDIDMTASENSTASSTSTSNLSYPAHSTDSETNTRKKRRRVSREKEPTRTYPEDEVRASKRSRDTSSQAPTQEDDYTTSTSLGTEDISAEVQRRLNIKEDQRRKKENQKPDKRKRESLASNEGASPALSRPRTKRLKVEYVRKREGDLELENETDSPKTKRRKSP
jgi:hypothetical protein